LAITANMVKELREKTGAGMMECKKALADTAGDFDKAVNLLRQKGVAVAAKRESRATNEGTIGVYASEDGKTGALVELACETSFVAKTDQFVELAQNLAKQVASPDFSGDVDLLEQPYIAEPAAKVQEALTEIIGKLGEKIVISRTARVQAQGCGMVGQYLHTGGQIGVLVELGCEGDCSTGLDDMKGLARDIAMQVAWGTPQFLNRDEIPAEKLEQEREVHRPRWIGSSLADLRSSLRRSSSSISRSSVTRI
jgi:elongation factor Ts